MNSPTEINNLLFYDDDITNPYNNKSFSSSNIIIITYHGKNIIHIHFSYKKVVSIGRSRQNDIHLSDPHFPRKAAEIILGPIPILRKISRTGKSGHKIVPVPQGKSFKISPYTIRLVKSGEVLINRWVNKKKPKYLKRVISFAFIVFIFSFTIYLLYIHPKCNTDKIDKNAYANINKNKESLFHDKTTQLQTVKNNINSHENSIRKTNNAPTDKDDTKLLNIQMPFSFKAISKIDALGSSSTESQLIPETELESLIQTAQTFINQGYPKKAGRMIQPVVKILSKEQIAFLIKNLEPEMKSLYQKAYMLMGYDREAAMITFDKIVQSKLDMLPSYEKAMAILEKEKRINSSLGGINRPVNQLNGTY